MSFVNCLKQKLDDGFITKGQYEKIESLYNDTFDRYSQTMGSDSAAAAAAFKVANNEANYIIKKNINKIRAAQKQVEIKNDLDIKYEETKKFLDSLNSAQKKFLYSIGQAGSYAGHVRDFLEDVYTRSQSIKYTVSASLSNFIERNRAKFGGLKQDNKMMPDVVRAIIDGSTTNAEAAALAKEVKNALDTLRDMFTNAGGIMGKVDNYFPMRHIPEKVRTVSFDRWQAEILPLLDTSKMIDPETGMPFTPDKLAAEMFDDYQTITTRGFNKIAEASDAGKQRMGMGGEIASRREFSRFYVFKNADSFLQYNEKFGSNENELFDTVMHYVEGMARDIAMLQKMGPAPKSIMRYLEKRIEAKSEGRPFKQGIQWVNGMFDVLSGATNATGLEGISYRTLEGTKDVLRAAQLGSTPIAAFPDAFMIAYTSKLNGMSWWNTVTNYFKMLNPLVPKDQRIAGRMGFIADSLNGRSFSAARFADVDSSFKTTRQLSTFVNYASGLQWMTNAGKDAISLEVMGTMADNAIDKTPWRSLNKQFRDSLVKRGINQADYEKLITFDLWRPTQDERVSFLTPEKVAEKDLELSLKYFDYINSLRNIALNEPTLKTRAITTGAAFGSGQSGTFGRAFWSAGTMYKSYPITMAINHLGPALKNAAAGKVGNLGAIILFTTVLGGMSMQAGNLIKGNSPEDMDNWRFWRAAMLRGGGFGLFGDFMFSDKSRFGRNFQTEAAGPVAGLAGDVINLFMGNLQQALDGKDTNFLSETWRFAARNTPGINLWYSRLLVERALIDPVDRMLDPNFEKRIRRLERQAYKERGVTPYWSRTDSLYE